MERITVSFFEAHNSRQSRISRGVAKLREILWPDGGAAVECGDVEWDLSPALLVEPVGNLRILNPSLRVDCAGTL